MAKRGSRDQSGKLRIISGRWRGRRFQCPPGEVTRPTGDRIRETLFNWLDLCVAGSRCLDLFAGSGALGLEALSRGAAGVIFVEQDAHVARQLEETLRHLDCAEGEVIKGDALDFLAGTPQPFDIIFVDPPFGLIDPENLCTLLDNKWLNHDAHIYIEMRRGDAVPKLPPGWAVIRNKTAGQVQFMLVRRAGE
ncbi:MAG: 16S rRNA (guanine(966)-N(2))-methyltransferase RsmD [Gammaproteobacteria bacterium]|nr:16S rRNA (guanine(966)-N(2))-methyltransferase RsmD [Gammaproteobacteria bacterium]